ncbi:hypothetical protein ACVWWW_001792 [Lysobacter sp. HA18]
MEKKSTPKKRPKPAHKTVQSARERIEQLDDRRMRREGRPLTAARRTTPLREDV